MAIAASRWAMRALAAAASKRLAGLNGLCEADVGVCAPEPAAEPGRERGVDACD